jgi:hypothetical protein
MFKTSNCFSLTAFVKVCFAHLNLRFWLLFRISDLEFRIYPLLGQKNQFPTLCVQQSHLWVKIRFHSLWLRFFWRDGRWFFLD